MRRGLIFELICESAKMYVFKKFRINLLDCLSMFYFCLNTPPTVASPNHFILRICVFRKNLCTVEDFAIGSVLVISCEPVKAENESRNFST